MDEIVLEELSAVDRRNDIGVRESVVLENLGVVRRLERSVVLGKEDALRTRGLAKIGGGESLINVVRR